MLLSSNSLIFFLEIHIVIQFNFSSSELPQVKYLKGEIKRTVWSSIPKNLRAGIEIP
jgi:hypothetical protein